MKGTLAECAKSDARLRELPRPAADKSALGPEQTKLAKRYGFKQCAPGD